MNSTNDVLAGVDQATPATTVDHTKLTFNRVFTAEGKDPWSSVEWVKKDAVIVGGDGREVFRMDGVEVPNWWPETTVNVVAEKYFRVVNGVKETSAKQMFARVADWITRQGIEQGVLESGEQARVFLDELIYMFVNGMYAFNSPVWFNVGASKEAQPQCGACFIQSVTDTMSSIMDLATREVMVFKGGSGSGTNFSNLRSSHERLSRGGYSSGPVSFMAGLDAFAGVTKSGGTTRRAAKMCILNADHPDILEQYSGKPGFITCKADAEEQARALWESGRYSAEWNKPGNVYDRVGYQNANNSMRAPDSFMKAVEDDLTWDTFTVKERKLFKTYQARKIFDAVVRSAHLCGDPGLQFDSTINGWHTCPESGRINASNPCAEYLFLDDTSCNLGSLNLMRFAQGPKFNTEAFIHACEIAITAKEIIVDASSYPTELIKENSRKFRTLGIGFSNFGSLLVFWGIPYNSEHGRAVGGAIASLMTAASYRQSAVLARKLGPFPEFQKNRESMLRVIRRHWNASEGFNYRFDQERRSIIKTALELWAEAYHLGESSGYRNAQVSLLAPTGTISFLMACDTTSGEPMLGCVTYKKIVGGGLLTLPNRIIPQALENLGYEQANIARILEHLRQTGDIHSAADFDEEKHGPIFAEALGTHALTPEAHIDMMAAIQPFLSGGISKTVNVPADASLADVDKLYMRAWKKGVKCIAVFRDGCKLSQPTNLQAGETANSKERLKWGERKRLPNTRKGETHKFTIQGQEGYITTGLYPDGSLAEIFVRMAKQGSTLNGFADMWATAFSIGLQHGVPLPTMIDKMKDTRFEPYGLTDHENIRMTWSIGDYISRWLELTFLQPQENLTPIDPKKPVGLSYDGGPCVSCGNLTKRSGSCYVCVACGTTTGCS